MYNEQLENLIEMALMDGELTEKEKQVLFKKADGFGVDLDEFEMVLDARLFAKQKADAPAAPAPPQAAAPQATSQTNKHGDINKCPSCGSPVPSMASSCADCGHDFSNIAAVSSVHKLHDQLQKVEQEERDRVINEGGGMLGKLTAATDNPADRITTRKASVVSSFPVPNSKEDILEFLTMAIAESKNRPNRLMRMTPAGALYKAWIAKAEQIIMKAKFSMKEDKSTLEEIMSYAKELGIK